jgi:hypothetical protein
MPEHLLPNLQAALAYARAGWPVFPCIPGEKVPATAHGFENATTDPCQIRSWWARNPERNVAIATGRPGPDVVDVDVHGEHSGFPSWNQMKREGLTGTPRAVIRTPSGGMHAYYEGTDQQGGRIRTAHVDFRAQGGYVVAPPSQVGGRPYVVVSHQPSNDTFDWQAGRKLLDPQPERQREPYERPAGARPQDLSHLARHVARQEPGNRNDSLYWAANRAIEQGRHDVLDELARAGQAAGLTERETDATIRSAVRTSAQQAAPGPQERPAVRLSETREPEGRTATRQMAAGRDAQAETQQQEAAAEAATAPRQPGPGPAADAGTARPFEPQAAREAG